MKILKNILLFPWRFCRAYVELRMKRGVLGVMGWDDLIYLAIGTALQQGAQKAMSPGGGASGQNPLNQQVGFLDPMVQPNQQQPQLQPQQFQPLDLNSLVRPRY